MSNHILRRRGRPASATLIALAALLLGTVLSRLTLLVLVAGAAVAEASKRRRREPADRGQAMTEYVLLLLGVAAIALLVTGWAARTGKVGELLDRVFDTITGRVA